MMRFCFFPPLFFFCILLFFFFFGLLFCFVMFFCFSNYNFDTCEICQMDIPGNVSVLYNFGAVM